MVAGSACGRIKYLVVLVLGEDTNKDDQPSPPAHHQHYLLPSSGGSSQTCWLAATMCVRGACALAGPHPLAEAGAKPHFIVVSNQ